ncbi:Urea carboxylase-related ABC transporter, periplasmic substrate-binding protein [Polaromonas sp. CG9_12]|uniref:ABC transporter substrate-binding protein n=1 Tax=Polaromonas sp. CG_9.11 TaxID=2787730 RepID=UPI0004DDD82A|nr:ABC transporter substrate-binding protein [Polaromonas sp. CG_9.11]MBG6077565.1 NitT/TauT family transport system substrate-binding protein [Polaromonas sp. CG_9.11]CDS52828.1 Urea carboxylase-related ABC transporter, periplasmic substrate-binding protein [Polaromonas sp. CG9_12]
MKSSGFPLSPAGKASLLGRLFKPALGVAVALAAASAVAAAPTSMKIGTVVWIGYGPFYVADALDLYKKYNLKVSLQVFNDPALIPSAMASGAVDGAMLTYDQVVGQAASGKRQKVVMPIDYSNGGDAIVADSSITKVSDFKGKKVGFNPLSPSDFLLSYALKTNGMTDKDITAVNMTPEAVPAAMASGQMPIGVTYEPSLSQILGQGGGKKFKVVYSSKNAPGLIADVLVFDDQAIKTRPAEITGIMKAYLDGLAYMKAKPEESAKIIGKFMGVTPKEVKEQLAGVYNIPLAEMPKAFVKAKETTSYYASGDVIGQLLKAKGQITTVPPIETTFDAQFVSALAKK